MSDDVKYDNSGALFKNEDKLADGENPNWPDYKGKITVEGRMFWLSAWVTTGKKGKFLSIKCKPAEEKKAAAPAAAAVPSAPKAEEDNLPF